MEVQGETSVKSGVATPVVTTGTPASPTRAQIAEQGKQVLEAFQEATVLGRRHAAAVIAACKAFYIFDQDARRANAEDELAKVVKAFNIKREREAEYLKRVRTTGQAAAHPTYGKQFEKIQHALPAYLESLYAVAKIFLIGTDADRQCLADAVAKGELTVNSTLEEIRVLHRPPFERASAAPTGRRATTTAADVPPESMTEDQLVAQARAQGITSPAKQREFVQRAKALMGQPTAPPITATALAERGEVDLTPRTVVPVEQATAPFRLEDMVFSDITVDGDTITGRFVIRNARRSDVKWLAALPTQLREALQSAKV